MIQRWQVIRFLIKRGKQVERERERGGGREEGRESGCSVNGTGIVFYVPFVEAISRRAARNFPSPKGMRDRRVFFYSFVKARRQFR